MSKPLSIEVIFVDKQDLTLLLAEVKEKLKKGINLKISTIATPNNVENLAVLLQCLQEDLGGLYTQLGYDYPRGDYPTIFYYFIKGLSVEPDR